MVLRCHCPNGRERGRKGHLGRRVQQLRPASPEQGGKVESGRLPRHVVQPGQRVQRHCVCHCYGSEWAGGCWWAVYRFQQHPPRGLGSSPQQRNAGHHVHGCRLQSVCRSNQPVQHAAAELHRGHRCPVCDKLHSGRWNQWQQYHQHYRGVYHWRILPAGRRRQPGRGELGGGRILQHQRRSAPGDGGLRPFGQVRTAWTVPSCRYPQAEQSRTRQGWRDARRRQHRFHSTQLHA